MIPYTQEELACVETINQSYEEQKELFQISLIVQAFGGFFGWLSILVFLAMTGMPPQLFTL
jgi:hypothetical protein